MVFASGRVFILYAKDYDNYVAHSRDSVPPCADPIYFVNPFEFAKNVSFLGVPVWHIICS